jgi:hypothetical protein
MSDEMGLFTISLDTELAWGTFDTEKGYERYETAYLRARDIITDICNLFDEYMVPATWAIVAHLLDDCDRTHDSFPIINLEWINDWYGSLPCATGMDLKLWYAPEIIEAIQNCTVKQDIGLHGYSHLILGAPNCSREISQWEVTTAVETLEDHGIEPSSFVYPRNQIDHIEVLAEAGLEVYRGRDDIWFERWNIPNISRKPFRYLNEALSWDPPVVTPKKRQGMIEVPGSQVFRPFHDGWEYTPNWTQVSRAKTGLDKAARTGQIFHLRFHPFDLGFDPQLLLSRLEEILSYANRLREEGDLKIVSLKEIANEDCIVFR